MSVFGQLASLLIRPEKDAGFEDTFASRFGAAPLDPFEAAALRQRQFTNRQQASGAERAERAGPAVLGGLADLSKSLGEPVTRITDYSRSRVGTEAPLTEEDVFRQDLASRNIGKGVAQAGAYGLPLKNPLGKVPSQAELRGGQLFSKTTNPLYHGSPQAGLRVLNESVRGPLGPGVYTSPAEQIAGSYSRSHAPEGGTIYKLPVKDRDIYQGAGHRTDAEWFGFKEDKKRLLEAAEPDKRAALSGILDKMWSGDGYPTYGRIRQLYGGDEPAQALFKKAGFEGISGQVDGPETLLFGKQVLQPGIRAYHGSPHDFDKFDLSKIGTGEGAQAYGHGLYFAENEGVARGYRDAVTKARSQELPDAGYFNLREPIDTYGTGLSQLNDKFRQMGAGAEGKIDQATILRAIDAELAPHYSGRFKGPVAADTMKKWEEARKFVEARPEMSWRPEPYKGRMYEVSLNARPEQFLDWDRPLAQQPAEVAGLFKPESLPAKNLERTVGFLKREPVGEQLYRALGLGAEEQSAKLRDAGISGIRYHDQGSRLNTGNDRSILQNQLKATQALHAKTPTAYTTKEIARLEGLIERAPPLTSNYVVFDPGIIDILRKYGLAGATAAPFGALAAQDNYRSD